MSVLIKFKKLKEEAKIPSYQHPTDAGMDICTTEAHMLYPGQMYMAPTGLAIDIPPGYECQVRPRSGLAAKHYITVLNSPGTIDSGYTGEIKVLLFNHGLRPYDIVVGERIAQLVVSQLPAVFIEEVKEIAKTERGASGFGDSGRL